MKQSSPKPSQPISSFHATKIAALSGASIPTVLRVLRGDPVRPSSLERIERAIAQLEASGGVVGTSK